MSSVNDPVDPVDRLRCPLVGGAVKRIMAGVVDVIGCVFRRTVIRTRNLREKAGYGRDVEAAG